MLGFGWVSVGLGADQANPLLLLTPLACAVADHVNDAKLDLVFGKDGLYMFMASSY